MPGQKLIARLGLLPKEPLSLTHLNQLLHLNHEAGVSSGFFRYYFHEIPQNHPYPIEPLLDEIPKLSLGAIDSCEQLRLGFHRFFVDSLLYWGNFRTAYRELRVMSYDEIVKFFANQRIDSEAFQRRGPVLPFEEIPADDRYLIAELACKAYTPRKGSSETLLEAELLKAYRACGQSKIPVKMLISMAEQANEADLQAQLSFKFSCEEFLEAVIESDEQLRSRIREVAQRFGRARERALQNTANYLSIVNELDVYVATSMRNREDFRDMSRNCQSIFKNEKLTPFNLRYFDPTNSAAESHEDKGLIECLMVKCAKVLIYFAGEKESFGKDVEAGMALSLGKPVIIYCPPTPEGEKRMRFFRDIHPLSRLIDVGSGVAVGAMITNHLEHVIELIYRVFANEMEYDVEHDGDGYFRLVERLTKSVVRLQTNSKMLRETFWNYYHGVV
ncbi:MAG: hypothetical protein LAN84_00530 [Acidobacteriia bacterium]|nr:hypothetical protein [Terriglobia bacterium]